MTVGSGVRGGRGAERARAADLVKPTAIDPLQRLMALGRRGIAFVGAPDRAFQLAAVAVVTALILVLAPIVGGAYSADDTWNSQLPARLAADGITGWDYVVRETQGWARSSGRFFPGSIASTTAIFTTLDSRVAYKLFQLFVVLVAVASLTAWIGYLTRNRWNAVLAAALMTTLLQFRFTYDAVQHFNGQQSIIVAGLFTTLLCVLAYVRSGRWVLGVAALVVWSATLVTYESTYLLAPALLVVTFAVSASLRRRVAALTWVAAPTLVLGLLIVWLRSRMTAPPAASYTVSLDPAAVATTWVEQVTAALPLAERVLGDQQRLSGLALPSSAASWAVLVLVAGVTCVATVRARVTVRSGLVLGLVGLQFLVVPAALVAITLRWQQEVSPGVGYIAVYLQSFGLAALGVVALGWLARHVQGALRRGRNTWLARSAVAVVALAVGVVAATIAQNNHRVVTATDPALGWMAQQPMSGWSRDLADRALERGLLSAHGDSSVVAVPGAPWLNSVYVSHRSRRDVAVVNPWAFFTVSPADDSVVPGCPLNPGPCQPSDAYDAALYVGASGYGSGLAVVGDVARAATVSDVRNDVALELEDATVYLESPELEGRDAIELCHLAPTSVGGGLSQKPGPSVPPTVLSRGDDWALLRLPLVDVERLGLRTPMGCDPLRVALPWDSLVAE